MVIGLFIDIWNWLFTRRRAQLVRTDAREIWQAYRLRISMLGVIYTVVEVEKTIPDHLIDRYLSQKLNAVDDCLVSIGLDGLMHFKAIKYGETETVRIMLVKFIPNMPHWTWWYFISSVILTFVLVRLGVYFSWWSFIWSYIYQYTKPVIDAFY